MKYVYWYLISGLSVARYYNFENSCIETAQLVAGHIFSCPSHKPCTGHMFQPKYLRPVLFRFSLHVEYKSILLYLYLLRSDQMLLNSNFISTLYFCSWFYSLNVSCIQILPSPGMLLFTRPCIPSVCHTLCMFLFPHLAVMHWRASVTHNTRTRKSQEFMATHTCHSVGFHIIDP